MRMTNNDYFCINEDKVKANHVLYKDPDGFYHLEIWNCSKTIPDYVFNEKEFYTDLDPETAERELIPWLFECGNRLASPIDITNLIQFIDTLRNPE